MTLLKDLTGQYAIFEAERTRRQKEALDPATKAFADAQKELLINQTEIDKTVLKNMESIGETLRLMHSLQLGFIGLNDKANELLNKIIKGEIGLDFKDLVFNLSESIQNNIAEALRRQERRTETPENPPVPTGPPSGPNNPPPPPPPVQPNTSGSGSQSDTSPAEQRTAALERDIERLNRELEALRNNPQPNNRDADERNVAILRELQEHTTLLQRIRDGQA